MKRGDFDYDLPAERIAQRPADTRDASRLLVLDRDSGAVSHRGFAELTELLRPGDLLVLNDTRVRCARLVGTKASGGRIELLLLEPVEEGADRSDWRAMVRSSRKPAPGSVVRFGGALQCEVVEAGAGEGIFRFAHPAVEMERILEATGQVPLPPYIRRDPPFAPDEIDAQDRERYQTVFAERTGAVAAPTAGLHFSRELLEALDRRGVRRCTLTLHVGPGTFLPVRTECVEDHRMHAERIDVGDRVAEEVEAARARGGRIVAVGTTVVRSLEFCAERDGRIRPRRGECDLFIVPGHRFRAVDAMITNFHLPGSTLLMLVCAFAGRENVLAAYREAIRLDYRFYSYGDAMLVGSSP